MSSSVAPPRTAIRCRRRSSSASRQIEIIRPRLVCTLGNFATKLISGRDTGITKVHGSELPLRIGDHDVLLYPLFHPAAALYQRSTLALLEEDFARIPALLGEGAPPVAEPAIPPAPIAAGEATQLGLF
jgi:uracil-DNA glycosylase